MPEGNSGISFYEKVVVLASPDYPGFVGQTGVVVGASKRGKTVLAFGVMFEGEAHMLTFAPGDLRGTGVVLDRSELYDDSQVIRVTQSGQLAD